MANANGVFVFGQYSMQYAGSLMGLMQGDAGVPTIVTTAMARLINNTDGYGDCELGGVFRGVKGRVQCRAQEYKAAVLAAAWPWGADGTVGVIGRDLYDLAAPLILTAITGTPAFTQAAPASLTINKAIIPPDFNVSLAFGPILREVPLEFIMFLVGNGGPTTPTTQATGILYSKT